MKDVDLPLKVRVSPCPERTPSRRMQGGLRSSCHCVYSLPVILQTHSPLVNKSVTTLLEGQKVTCSPRGLGEDRQTIPEAHWPCDLPKSLSLGSVADHVSENREVVEKMPPKTSSGLYIHTSKYKTHNLIHTCTAYSTHKCIYRYFIFLERKEKLVKSPRSHWQFKQAFVLAWRLTASGSMAARSPGPCYQGALAVSSMTHTTTKAGTVTSEARGPE